MKNHKTTVNRGGIRCEKENEEKPPAGGRQKVSKRGEKRKKKERAEGMRSNMKRNVEGIRAQGRGEKSEVGLGSNIQNHVNNPLHLH